MIDVEMQGRSALRRAAHVYCETVRNKGFRRIGLRTRDLSLAGALVETEDLDVEIGEEVFLAFKAPRTRFWMDARARVVRLLHGRRREDAGKRAIGLEFVELDGVYRAVLRGALQYLPPPIPRRPQRESIIEVVVDLAGE
jgi:hypothetical protein